MLDLLVRYAQAHDLALPPGYASKPVRWLIDLGATGKFLAVIELGDTSIKKNPGRTFPCCPDLQQGELVALKGCHFLAESASVVACYEADAKGTSKHGFFVGLLEEAGMEVPELAVAGKALRDAATLEQIQAALAAQKAKATDRVTFMVDGILPLEEDTWHDWWDRFRAEKLGSSGGGQMICFATGQIVAPVATHPKIGGLSDVGGIGMGSPLVGFDKSSFESYGLKQSANAATGGEAAAAYRAALNELITNHSQRLVNTKVVHWYRTPVPPENDPMIRVEQGWAQEEGAAQKLAAELLAAFDTAAPSDLRDNTYYALTVSGSGGRVMIRDWMEGRFEDLARSVYGWFEDLAIVRRDGAGLAAPPKFLAVVGATTRDLSDVPAPLIIKLWRSAVHREKVPVEALTQALARARIDIIRGDNANHARMGLLRCYHVRNEGDTAMLPSLNEQHPEPAYHCGRLLAVLARLQRAALGDVNAGVVQRFYPAASATPGLVLGRLVRTSQFHLSKLDPRLAYWYEGRIADIMASMGEELPAILPLKDQSLFALGYYQQMAQDRQGGMKSNSGNDDKDAAEAEGEEAGNE